MVYWQANMKSPILVIPATLIIAGVVGFIAGRSTSPSPSVASSGENAGPSATRASRSGPQSAAEAIASGRRENRSQRVATMSATQRNAQLESIMRNENPLERGQALLDFLKQLGPGDFEDAVAHFRSLGMTDSRMGEYALLLSAWAESDPMSALTYAQENTGGRFATETILSTWATLDPLAAIRWAEQNHEGDGANPHMAGVIRGIAASDPALATRLLTEMPRSRERGDALDAILPHLLTQGNDAARQWIESLGDESLRSGAMMRVAERFAETDPAGTVSWLLQNPNEATQRRMDDVFNTWTRKDPQAAMQSLASLPAGEVRTDALRGIVSAVSSSDPAMGLSIMDRHSADVNNDVVRNFVWHAFGSDPAAAASQIARISAMS